MTGKTTQRRAAAVRASARVQRPKSSDSTFTVETIEVPDDRTEVDSEPDMDSKHKVGLRELEERVGDVRDSCWSNESLFEDIIDGIEDAKHKPGGNSQSSDSDYNSH